MKLVVYSNIRSLEDLNFTLYEPHIVILLGDIAEHVVKKIDEHYKGVKIGIYGEYDRYNFFEGTDILNMHEYVAKIDEKVFVGYEGVPNYVNDGVVPEHTENDARAYLKNLADFDVFIAHANRGDMEAKMDTDQFVPYSMFSPDRGFDAFTQLMDENNINHFFYGHCEENVETEYNGTKVHGVYGMREFEI